MGEQYAGDVPASPAVLMELIVDCELIWPRTVEEQCIETAMEVVLTDRVVGDRPHHISGNGIGLWGIFFSKRVRDHAAPNCVID